MPDRLLMQFLVLSLYAFFMGFCFCDGFKLHTARKLIWFGVFLVVCVYVLRQKGEFELLLILPLPLLLGVLLCVYEKLRHKGTK
jgi:hypothetical protein